MNKLYVANIPDDLTAEEIQEAFGENVESVEMGVEERPAKDDNPPLRFPYAIVTMPSEKIATRTMHRMNGVQVEGYRVAVSPAEFSRIKPLTSKNRRTLEEIAETLEETDTKPLRMLEAIVTLCGAGFAQTILEETLEIEEGEGIPTQDGERRRTTGGVFFYLARFRMSPDMRKIVYNRKGRLPSEDDESSTEETSENQPEAVSSE